VAVVSFFQVGCFLVISAPYFFLSGKATPPQEIKVSRTIHCFLYY